MAQREFRFTDRDFGYISDLVRRQTGIVLSDTKKQMVYSRLARRLRALGLDEFKSYCNLLRQGGSDELENFVNAITTNLTSFFRERHHFEYLADRLLPELLHKNRASRKIRIWSAGCSTGEEPYSIAMVVHEVLSQQRGWDVKILATDLDSNVLAHGRHGVYEEARASGMSKPRLKRWFRRGKNGYAGQVRMAPELQETISFRQLNLMHEWPFNGPFDLIFCRNVVIYFDKETQRSLVTRFADLLDDEGHLFMGHSESLFKVSTRFKLIGNTIYRKIG